MFAARRKIMPKMKTRQETYERLDEYFELLTLIPNLENEITRCIVSETEIADDASAGLKSVRKESRFPMTV